MAEGLGSHGSCLWLLMLHLATCQTWEQRLPRRRSNLRLPCQACPPVAACSCCTASRPSSMHPCGFVSHVSSVTGVQVLMYAPSICSQPSSNLILSVDYDTSCRALPLMSTTTHRLRTKAFSREWTMMLTLSVWSACTAAGAWLDLDTLFVDLQMDSSRAAGAHTPQTVDHVLPDPQPLL